MISVEDARDRILAAFRLMPAETVSLEAGLGRVLASDLQARLDQPPADVSAMDGYAVRATDVVEAPARLTVIGEIPAGGHFAGTVGEGQAVRIFTGAALPDGADTIVIQEDTARDGDIVEVRETADRGRFVRPAGLDFRVGETALSAGRRLTARDIGLAAAMDHAWLPVRRQPRVAILATGDEVVLPGEPRSPQQIVSSNGFSLAALVTACGGEAINLGIAPDDRDALSVQLDGARGADLLLTSGGASVGAHDLIQEVLQAKGLDLDFWKIAMRPGKPLMFGRLGETPVIGLPGNPVSGLVCSTLFVRPAIARMLGSRDEESRKTAVLDVDLPANDRRQDYLRAKMTVGEDGSRTVRPFDKQDSSMLKNLAQADCLVVRPPHAPAASAGDTVEIVDFAAPTGSL